MIVQKGAEILFLSFGMKFLDINRSHFVQFLIEEMSQQSSFRQMYQYPNQGFINKQRKYVLKGYHNKGGHIQLEKKKQTFYSIVQKAKYVNIFIRNLKQKVAENRTFHSHTLKDHELQYLENDAQHQESSAYFSCENKVVLTFQILYIITNLLYLWQCTFEIVFGEMPTSEIINGVTLFFYLVHIGLFQLTEHKNQKSQIVNDLKQLKQIYIKEKLAKDTISLIVITLQLTPLDNYEHSRPLFMILRILSLLSYLELSKTYDKVENLLVISMESQIMNSLLKLCFKILFFLHCLSIILNLLVSIEHSFNIYNTWLDNKNLSYSTNIQKYVIGWYWGSTILSTVGFGQIIPANNFQRFFISIVEVVCCMTFGYFVNAIGEIIKLKAQPQEKYEKEMRKLKRYLHDMPVSNQIKHKIRTQYFNKQIVEQIHNPNEEKQILNTITPDLRYTLLQENNLKLVKKCSALETFKLRTLTKLAESLNRVILAPENILYSRKISEKKLWFIQSGTVQELTDNFEKASMSKVLSIYNQKNPLVGWFSFFLPGLNKSIAKAKNYTVAHEVSQKQFVACVAHEIKEYHKYVEMKHRIQQKNRRYENKCMSCGRYTHNVIDCPRIHLVKKDGYKIVLQKKQLDRYRESQSKKTERSGVSYNWKRLFGIKKMEKEVKQLIKDENTDTLKGTIQNYLKKLSNRESINIEQRRRGSMCLIIPKEFKGQGHNDNDKTPAKFLQSNIDKSIISFEAQGQEKALQFEKAFYNKQAESYMPQNDIEKVLAQYKDKIKPKKHSTSSRDLASTQRH